MNRQPRLVRVFGRLIPICVVLAVRCSTALADTNHYLGVASCASSNCHGSVSPRSGSDVLQNEYAVLAGTRSTCQSFYKFKRTRGKTNWYGARYCRASARKDVPRLPCDKRSATIARTEVPDRGWCRCESCHGAAGGYIQTHTSRSATHADNLARGMSDIVAPEKRAALCVTCHLGNDEKKQLHTVLSARVIRGFRLKLTRLA